MTVYVDVLIIVNTIIDYFILLTAQRLSKTNCKRYRMVLAALLGGALSLYIFAPDYGVAVNTVVWLLSGAMIVLSACCKNEFKKILRLYFAYIFTNAVYGGVVTAFWMLFKPRGMVVFNGIVYYQLSPIILLVVTVLCYTAITLSERFLKLKAPMAQRCRILLCYGNLSIELEAIIDTGHSLCDPFSERSVIIVDAAKLEEITKIIPQNKYRIIPYSDISGRGVLNAFVADKAQIYLNDKNYVIIKPTIAAAKTGMLPQEFSALLSPQIFNEESECVKT